MPLAAADNTCYIFPPMIKFDRNFIFYKLPPVLYAMLIIFVSTIPNVKPPSLGVSFTDKIYHCSEYLVLALLIFRAFPGVHQSKKRTVLYVLLFCFGLAYAALDETVQYFVPTRDSSIFDWMADATGYIIGGTLFILYRVKSRKSRMAQD